MSVKKKGLSIAVLLGLLALTGCDQAADSNPNEPDQTAQSAPIAQPVAQSTAQTFAPEPASGTPTAAETSPNSPVRLSSGTVTPLTVIDASEVQLDGAATLVLTFSAPLDENQNINSLLHLIDDHKGAVEGGWELSTSRKELRFRHLEPARQLVVTLDSGLKAANGAILAQPFRQKIETRDVQPMVGFASRGSLLPTKLAQGLPVLALNINNIDVDFFRVKPASLPAFLASWQYGNTLSTWQSQEILTKADLVYSGRFDLNPRKNTREKLQLPLNSIDELKKPGVYLAVMKQAGSYNYSNPATLFMLSDIGLALHKFPNKLALFTQSLENGAAISGASLTLLDSKGRVLAKTTSDAQGYAELPVFAETKLVLAKQGDQTSLLDLTRPALDLAEFAIAGPQGADKQLFIFGPRDLYRPGETAVVNALLRDADGQPLPPQPLNLEVVKPDGEIVRTLVWQPENGLYQYRFPLPDSAVTGKWSFRLNSGDNRKQSWSFNVEDFLPERMALEIENSSTPRRREDNIIFDVSGRYLYGAPAAGNTLQGQLFLRPLREAVPSLPGYQFGDINEASLRRSLDEVDLKLDGQGRSKVVVESDWKQTHSPLNVILQASLLEAGGRPVTRTVAQAIWPAEAITGIRPLFGNKDVYDYRSDSYRSQPVVEENATAAFELVYANSAGEKLAARDLDVRLIKERRDYYWSFSDSEGWRSRFDQKDLVEDQRSLTIAENGSVQVEYPVEWGSYRLEVHSPDTGAVSSIRFWAGYSWQDNTDGSGALRPDQVKLKLDKPVYQPGEKATVYVESPAAGKGYLMVESSNGPLWWQEITVPEGGVEVKVPLNSAWKRHDLYLSALVIRPGEKSLASTPKRAVGLLHLPMAQENRRLALSLESVDKIRPEQTLKVKVKAAAQQGVMPKNITVLLSAVDSGALSITNFKTPDPWEAFFGRKRYNADQYDVYGQLIEGEGRLARLRFGGDGDEEEPLSRGGKKPVTHVNIVAQQLKSVQLNANGEGELELLIPQFNGELRLMAQAWSDNKFGSTQKKVVVAAPLVSELATPRFMAGGDHASLAMDVTNLTPQPQEINIAIQASGLLHLESTLPHHLQLKAGERKTIMLPVAALPGFGDGVINTEITGLQLPGEKLRVVKQQWQIGVRPAWPGITRSFASVIQPGESWSLPADALSGLETETLQGQVVLSNKPPLNIARYISELYAYPYGCLEQTASGLYPSLFTNQMQLKALGIKSSTNEARRAAIEVGIDRLAGMQRDNGGFGLWSKESPEEFWLTAYVTDFLVRASEQGYNVGKTVIASADRRLLRYLQDPSQIEVYYSADRDAVHFSVQAYAALVLAQQQKAPLGALRALYNKKDQASGGLSLVQLGIALKLMGDEPRSLQAINEGLAKLERKEEAVEDYGSDIRDRAKIFTLLSDNHLLPQEQDKLLLAISQRLNGRKWLSTQENNALFMVAKTLNEATGTGWQVAMNGNTLGGKGPMTIPIEAEQLKQGVQWQSHASSPVYARADVVGYPVAVPAAHHNVLEISRRYLDLNGKDVSLANLKSGDLILVSLKIWAKQRVPDALVVDMLPAGLELENQNLMSSSASLQESAADVQELMGDMQQANVRHIEFRDDRFVAAVDVDGYRPVTLLYLARAVTPGHYRLPPPQVESMYVPEWRAQGTTPGSLTVH